MINIDISANIIIIIIIISSSSSRCISISISIIATRRRPPRGRRRTPARPDSRARGGLASVLLLSSLL